MVEARSGSLDPLSELISKLHIHERPDLSKDEVKNLMASHAIDGDFVRHFMEELNLSHGPIRRVELIERIREADKHYGKRPVHLAISTLSTIRPVDHSASEPFPVRANPGLLFACFASSEASMPTTMDNPWKRTLSRLDLNTLRHSTEKIDVDCVMVTVHELTGGLFRHVNYKVEVSYGTSYGHGTSSYVNSVTIRRYSDFSWLHGFLLSKFPFRPVPPIPSKQFVPPTSEAELQLARDRAPGLKTFLISLIVHPVFANCPAVRAFLTEPGEFAQWRSSDADADISEELIPQSPAEEGEEGFVPVPQPLATDDLFFKDARDSLEMLGQYTKATLESIKCLATYSLKSADECNFLASNLKIVDSIVEVNKEEFNAVFSSLFQAHRESLQTGEELGGKVLLRLCILNTLVIGLGDAIDRLSALTFSEFPALSRRLVAIQGEIEKIRLRDDPALPSTEQLTLVTQLRRAQNEYLRHQRRNEWASETVKTEFEMFAKRHTNELIYALQDAAKFMQK